MKKKRIAIFASGSGTNAENIIRFFAGSATAETALVISNKPDAFVLERAAQLNVKSFIFNRSDFYESDIVIKKLSDEKIDLIILAGFLWMVPAGIIKAYTNRIINIHPALLPKFGGKGMYGMKVHEQVIASGEKESGITIHYVNENYDEGNIIFQAKCIVDKADTPEKLAEKIHILEYEYFPKVIEGVLLKEDFD